MAILLGMFDGQFRTKPTVTLRGSSQTGAAAEDVIAENRKRREVRRTQRREEQAALTIQRIIRGALSRAHVKQSSRDKFDQLIRSNNRVTCTRLLCHFYNPELDNFRLLSLLKLLENEWSDFSTSGNLYSVFLVLFTCVEDSHHQIVRLFCQTAPSLPFIQKIIQSKCFSSERLLELTQTKKILKYYAMLVKLIDKDGEEFLVSLLRILNEKYYSLIIKNILLNDEVVVKGVVDRVFSNAISPQLCELVLESLEIRDVCSKLDINFNHYLDLIVHFFSKFVSDSSVSNGMLEVFFKILNRYMLPAVVETSKNDSSDSSSDEEMQVEKVSFNFDCLEQLFVKCANGNTYLNTSYLAYLLIVKFNKSVIQTSPLRWLSFNPHFMRWSWQQVISQRASNSLNTGPKLSISRMSEGKGLSNKDYQQIVPAITVFCSLFYEHLRSSHDGDIISNALMFNVSELQKMCATCRDISVYLTKMDLIAIQPESAPGLRSAFTSRHISVPGSLAELDSRLVLAARDWVSCWSALTGLTRELYKRDTRLDIVDTRNEWLVSSNLQNITRDTVGVFIDPIAVPNLSLNTVKELSLLRRIPFIVPFSERVSIFHLILEEDAQQVRGGHAGWSQSGTVKATIRREFLYEDAFAQLNESVAPNLKQRLTVQLVNYSGLDEAGVDGGGLFREFLTSFLKEAFNPNRGFFAETDGRLHPNPTARHLYPDFQKHFFFIGRLLGKAVYEKLLVDIPLASYFLEKLLGGHADINHLRSLEPDLYRNILSLRTFSDSDLRAMCLYFTVSDSVLGDTKTIELKPGGSAIQVTRSNLIEYIHLMADYWLNRKIRVAFRNFAEGFYSVVPVEWLDMFSYSEFQSLLSGSETDIDIADLKENTVYQGRYSENHPTILLFWQVVDEMTPEQHRKLLAFVTSTDRTPLLGFKSLLPLFAIHSAGEEDRLPTASTCMNLLKLPEFSDKETLKKRLTYVIESEAGFELS